MHINEARVCATLAAALRNVLDRDAIVGDDVRAALESCVASLDALSGGVRPLGGEPIEDPDAWAAFLAEHPEIASAEIGYRPNRIFEGSPHLDLVADREYVSWGWGVIESEVCGGDVTMSQLIGALERACRATGRPVNAREIAHALWGKDALPQHVKPLSAALRRSDRVTVDRSSSPRRYSVATRAAALPGSDV